MAKWQCAVSMAACGTCNIVRQGNKNECAGRCEAATSLRSMGGEVYNAGKLCVCVCVCVCGGDVVSTEKDHDANVVNPNG